MEPNSAHTDEPIESLTEDLHDAGAATGPVDESTGAEQPPVEALAHALTTQGKLYAAANRHERMAENPDEFVFDGPFDAQRAIDEIFRLKGVVDDCARDYDRAKKKAAELKSEHEEAAQELDARIAQLKRWESGENEMQPRLRTLTDDERLNETADARRDRLAEQLTRKNFFVTVDELAALDRIALDTLDQWLFTADGVVPPDLLTRAHVMAVPSDASQCCARCGTAKVFHDNDTVTRPAGEWYPENAFVGLDCAGATEASRPKKRGRKRASTPEAEHEAQVEDANTRGDESTE